MALADEINRMVTAILQASTWTSSGGSNPVENFVQEVRGMETIDLEGIIQEIVLGVQNEKFDINKKIIDIDKKITEIERTTTQNKEAIQKTESDSKITKSDTLTKIDMPKFNVSDITKDDAVNVLAKAGISPQNTTNILKMVTGGSGIAGFGMNAITSFFPPAAIALMVAQLVPAIINELQRPGGWFDKRVKIDSRNEAFSVLDRQTRQNTRIGDRQVIIQQFEGFRNYEGFASTSTGELINKNADRVLDVGLFDRAQGMSSR